MLGSIGGCELSIPIQESLLRVRVCVHIYIYLYTRVVVLERRACNNHPRPLLF